MRYLLDTCLLSELLRPRPEPAVIEWLEARAEDELALSVLSLGEIEKGIAKLGDGARRQRIRTWLDGDLRDRFHGRVLPIDEAVAREWGRLSGEAGRKGLSLPVIDALLAATAREHSLVVVTRNKRDLERCGAKVFSPWPSP